MKGKRIILGISGGIAAYKSVYLLRLFQKAGADVRVVMTPSATRFVGLETLEALSRNPVPVHVFNEGTSADTNSWSRHIHWAEWADLMIVAPCTANTLAKIVHGLSDNMLTTTAMAVRCPLVLCPTMDGGMYRSAGTLRNLTLAKELGFHLIEPDSGYLASGLHDEGRLPEPEDIFNEVSGFFGASGAESASVSEKAPLPLKNKKVLVTAGPTREFIDAVRFISNPSSGKMGLSMAEAAHKLGAEVHVVHGKVSFPFPEYLNPVEITSASDLFEAVQKKKEWADVIIMSAAVSDFTPKTVSTTKTKKTTADSSIDLKPTTDILKWLGNNRKEGQVLVGFAMETENLEAEVKRKRVEKKSDWIVGNLLSPGKSGFETDRNEVYVNGNEMEFRLEGSKDQVAYETLRLIFGPKG